MSQPVQPYRDPEATPVGHTGTRVVIQEREAPSINGWFGVLVLAVCIGGAILLGKSSIKGLIALPIVVGVLIMGSLIIVQPGETKVVRFFGSYMGTVRRTGLSWIMPLADRRNVSTRVRNFETNHLKVNDADGNPGRDRRHRGLAGGRHVARPVRRRRLPQLRSGPGRVGAAPRGHHPPLRQPADDGLSLRGSTDIVAGELAVEVAERVVIAGVEIVEVRISHLAYAPEIAQAMLRRQQANAVVAARSRIVDGAVGMVELALQRSERAKRRRARRGAQGLHGEQPDGGAVQRPAGVARRQHRHALLVVGERP
jgi:hypothetical protein